MATRTRLKVRDSNRDKALEALLATRVQVSKDCVFINCTKSIPYLEKIYKANVPERALVHALHQSWHGILLLMSMENRPEYVVAHVKGEIKHVVHARDWIRVHDARVMYELHWLPTDHPYHQLQGLDISPVLGTPMPEHSAFFYAPEVQAQRSKGSPPQ